MDENFFRTLQFIEDGSLSKSLDVKNKPIGGLSKLSSKIRRKKKDRIIESHSNEIKTFLSVSYGLSGVYSWKNNKEDIIKLFKVHQHPKETTTSPQNIFDYICKDKWLEALDSRARADTENDSNQIITLWKKKIKTALNSKEENQIYQLVEYFINLMYSARASSGSGKLDEIITKWEKALYPAAAAANDPDNSDNKEEPKVDASAALSEIDDYLKNVGSVGSTNLPTSKKEVVDVDEVDVDIANVDNGNQKKDLTQEREQQQLKQDEEEENYSKIISLIRQELNTKTRYINDNEYKSEKSMSDDTVDGVIEKAMSIHSIEKFLKTVPEICEWANNVSQKLQKKHTKSGSVPSVIESINKTVERTRTFNEIVLCEFQKWPRATGARRRAATLQTRAAPAGTAKVMATSVPPPAAPRKGVEGAAAPRKAMRWRSLNNDNNDFVGVVPTAATAATAGGGGRMQKGGSLLSHHMTEALILAKVVWWASKKYKHATGWAERFLRTKHEEAVLHPESALFSARVYKLALNVLIRGRFLIASIGLMWALQSYASWNLSTISARRPGGGAELDKLHTISNAIVNRMTTYDFDAGEVAAAATKRPFWGIRKLIIEIDKIPGLIVCMFSQRTLIPSVVTEVISETQAQLHEKFVTRIVAEANRDQQSIEDGSDTIQSDNEAWLSTVFRNTISAVMKRGWTFTVLDFREIQRRMRTAVVIGKRKIDDYVAQAIDQAYLAADCIASAFIALAIAHVGLISIFIHIGFEDFMTTRLSLKEKIAIIASFSFYYHYMFVLPDDYRLDGRVEPQNTFEMTVLESMAVTAVDPENNRLLSVLDEAGGEGGAGGGKKKKKISRRKRRRKKKKKRSRRRRR